MSFFAGGGWRNATSPLAQATTTTNSVSASRQGSVDESIPGGLAERKPLLRTQTDPLAHLISRNSSQTSLASGTSNADAGRRFTFRGVARALPYFLRSTPAATTVSVASEEVERNAVSASPPSQSVAELNAKVPGRRSTLSEETSAPVAEGTAESINIGHEKRSESIETDEARGTKKRFVAQHGG